MPDAADTLAGTREEVAPAEESLPGIEEGVPTGSNGHAASGKRRRKRSADPLPVHPVVVPDKLVFSIGEVAELTGVPPYVLRYWESQFRIVAPEKNAAGQRIYRRREVEMILQIRRLLYEDGYTIAGARKRLRESVREAEEQVRSGEARRRRAEALAVVAGEVRDVLRTLRQPPE